MKCIATLRKEKDDIIKKINKKYFDDIMSYDMNMKSISQKAEALGSLEIELFNAAYKAGQKNETEQAVKRLLRGENEGYEYILLRKEKIKG